MHRAAYRNATYMINPLHFDLQSLRLNVRPLG